MANNDDQSLDLTGEQKAKTGAVKLPWQEPFARYSSVKADRSMQSASLLDHFAGSWAGQYFLRETSSTKSDRPLTPPLPFKASNRLGHPGMPEINFRPYDFHTNREGVDGPSLMGHPISFEVLGPTLKSNGLTHLWEFIQGAGGPGGGDKLRLVSSDSALSTSGSMDPPLQALTDIYGPQFVQSFIDGGFPHFLVISQGGGSSNARGLGDGRMPTATPTAPNGYAGLEARTEQSKFEIFRIVEINDDDRTITLDSNKRVTEFFDVPGGPALPCVRAVTILQPKATRLVAVPNSGPGKGQERAFVVVPPRRALWDDVRPPFKAFTADGGFDPYTQYDTTGDPGSLGDQVDWDDAPLLPVDKPLREGTGRVQKDGIDPNFAVLTMGRMRIFASTPNADDLGHVFHIVSAEEEGKAKLAGWTVAQPTEALLGWFEVMAVGADYYDLRRLPEWDPEVGTPFFGDGRIWQMQTPTAPGDNINLKWMVHAPIHSLWSNPTLRTEFLDAARLQNLIDPDQVNTTSKVGSGTIGAVGGNPDRAIFDTSSSGAGAEGTNANPGSLLDLGFRMVLFPAKKQDGTGNLIPDWDRPITSREVVLDPTKAGETQWVEIDYSSGVVTLSHAPKPGAGCEICPDENTLSPSTGEHGNARGELVLFASCVPYSREPSQSGAGFRVRGASQAFEDLDQASCEGLRDGEVADVYATRRYWPLLEGESITSGPAANDIILNDQLDLDDIPPAGFVDLRMDTGPLLSFGDRPASVFGYTSVAVESHGGSPRTVLKGVYGGGVVGDPPTVVPPGCVAMLRREVVTPSDPDCGVGTSFYEDLAYGQAARTQTLAFEADVVRERGGVTRVRRDVRVGEHSKLFEAVLSAWILEGGRVSGILTNTLTIAGSYVHIGGQYYTVPEKEFAAPATAADNYYLYVDGTTAKNFGSCPEYQMATALPLPGAHDILVWRGTSDGAVWTDVVDLRHFLNRIDRRDVITVGGMSSPQNITPSDGYHGPHFSTLAAAVRYANELGMPYGVGSLPGPHLTIRVVGTTTEHDVDLPIKVKCPGLIIEGGGTRRDWGTGSVAVQWSGEKFLFDVGGSWNATFRDLAFLYTGDDAAISLNHGVFSGGPANCTGLRIERCFLDHSGTTTPAAFLAIEAVGGVAFWNDVAIRDCHGSVGETFAFFGPNVTVSTTTLEDNRFRCSIPGETYGAVHVDKIGEDIHVDRNTFEDFGKGVYMVGSLFWVRDNRIEKTKFTGIELLKHGTTSQEVGTTVSGNHLLEIHSEVASPRIAIRVATTDPQILNNHIAFKDGAEDESLLISQESGSGLVQGNRAISPTFGGSMSVGGIKVESGTQVTNNLLNGTHAGHLTLASGNLVVGNQVGCLILPLSRTSNLIVADNIFSDTTGLVPLTGLLSHCRFTGNTFYQPVDLEVDNTHWSDNVFHHNDGVTLHSVITGLFDIAKTLEYENHPFLEVPPWDGTGQPFKAGTVFLNNKVHGGLVVENDQAKVNGNSVYGTITSRVFQSMVIPVLYAAPRDTIKMGMFVFGNGVTVNGNTVTHAAQVGAIVDKSDRVPNVSLSEAHGTNQGTVSGNRIGFSAAEFEAMRWMDGCLNVFVDYASIGSNTVHGHFMYGGDTASISGCHIGFFDATQPNWQAGFVALVGASRVELLGCRMYGLYPYSPLVYGEYGVEVSLLTPPLGRFLISGNAITEDVTLLWDDELYEGPIFSNNTLNKLYVRMHAVQVLGNRMLELYVGDMVSTFQPDGCLIQGNKVSTRIGVHRAKNYHLDNNMVLSDLGTFKPIDMTAEAVNGRITNNSCQEFTGVAPGGNTNVIGNSTHDPAGGPNTSWFGGVLPNSAPWSGLNTEV
jgi:hypothetical protein